MQLYQGISMFASDELYMRARTWLLERKDDQLIEVQLNLADYGWEELLEIDCAAAMIILTIKKADSGETCDIACDIKTMTALRRSPADHSAE